MRELSPAEKLKAFMRVRASLRDEPVIMYWEGNLYQQVDLHEATADYPPTGGFNPPNTPLFKLAGINISRAYFDPAIPRRDGTTSPGYCLMGREIMLYCDPATGRPLRAWENRMMPRNPDGTGGKITKTVNVLHVDNDPVNWVFTEAEARHFEFMPNGPDRLSICANVFLKSPSALAGERYRRHCANDIYQAAELFVMFGHKDEMFDPAVDNAPHHELAWVRYGPYLPWMHMGATPGGVVCVASGYKTAGFGSLPGWMQEEIHTNYPKYVAPPSGTYPGPEANIDSWGFFKQQLDSGAYTPTPIP